MAQSIIAAAMRVRSACNKENDKHNVAKKIGKKVCVWVVCIVLVRTYVPWQLDTM
jgi:hypothetical protein